VNPRATRAFARAHAAAPAADRSRPIVVTGVAGFIGMHVARTLLDRGLAVLGIDALAATPPIAHERLAHLAQHPNFAFTQLDLAVPGALDAATRSVEPAGVIHLAARTNPRSSAVDPAPFLRDNVTAFGHVLDWHRRRELPHLVFASTGSVAGDRTAEAAGQLRADEAAPQSVYAATKQAGEVLARSYAEAFALPITGVRIYNAYGPWARPDSAAMIFADALRAGEPMPWFGDGAMTRTFTYVGDVAAALADTLAAPPSDATGGPYRLLRAAAAEAHRIDEFATILADLMGCTPAAERLPMQPGDLQHSCGVSDLPCPTPLAIGLRRFVDWHASASATAPRAESSYASVGA
jgi:UDP-glucuronate 4-epimerase